MQYLLDTHIVLWLLRNDSLLSENVKKILKNENAEYYFSIASVWEVGIKHTMHKRDFVLSPEDFYQYCLQSGLRLLNLSVGHIVALDTLIQTSGHKDPFDRILLAQAKTENMYFLSHDKKLLQYGEKCLISV